MPELWVPKREGKELRYSGLSANAETDEMLVEGRAVIYGQRTVLFKLDGIDYYEVIEPGALDGADMKDVVFRYNHSEQMFVMARTRGGSLQLTVDEQGLLVTARMFNTSQARDLYELIKAQAVDKMSFAFTIQEESFNREERTWHVRKVDRLFDVAAVDQPAYEATSISARKALELESERTRLLDSELLRKRLIAMTYL